MFSVVLSLGFSTEASATTEKEKLTCTALLSSDMEIALVDSCGGRFSSTHGSVHIYEVSQSVWEAENPYALTPDETVSVMQDLVEEEEAELVKKVEVDDTVVV